MGAAMAILGLENPASPTGFYSSFLSKFKKEESPTTSATTLNPAASTSPPLSTPSLTVAPRTSIPSTVSYDPKKLGWSVAGAALGSVIGALVWKDHRVLGGLTGFNAGYHGATFAMTPNVYNASVLVVPAAEVAGALAWKSHPVLGWLGGGLLAALGVAGIHMVVRK